MKHEFQIKEALYTACKENVEIRISTIEQILVSIAEARNDETKSSAGDKYETGRAMLQIEEDNNKTQLLQAIQLRAQLQKIEFKKPHKKVGSGSLVSTNQSAYFISIGLGQITVQNRQFYCISPGSPIGMKMMDKMAGDEIEFNGTKIKIEEIF